MWRSIASCAVVFMLSGAQSYATESADNYTSAMAYSTRIMTPRPRKTENPKLAQVCGICRVGFGAFDYCVLVAPAVVGVQCYCVNFGLWGYVSCQ